MISKQADDLCDKLFNELNNDASERFIKVEALCRLVNKFINDDAEFITVSHQSLKMWLQERQIVLSW